MAKTDVKKSEGGLWETVKTVFWALLIAAAFRSLLFQPFSIPSGSMKPTLLIGDYLFVTKFAYGYSNYSFPFAPDLFDGRIWSAEPERGDVVVFKHPRYDACSAGPIGTVVGWVGAVMGQGGGPNDCVDYVKRVVGLPGDSIQVRAGVLHVNGQPLDTVRLEDHVERKDPAGSPPTMPRCTNDPVARGGLCIKERYRETFPGGEPVHEILNIHGPVGDAAGSRPRDQDNTPVFEVPEGHFFFMGDNRDNSVDSRFPSVGYVPFENLIGRADVVAISSDGPFWQVWNWRFSRTLEDIE
ncbi:MAG: signal peptidase I [Paracoccaceae bacterium]